MATIETYSGPKVQVQPNELGRFSANDWSAERKYDGHWCLIETGADGFPVSLIGRSGTRFSDDATREIKRVQFPPSSKFVCELEFGTESAVREHAKVGHRRIHVFDVINLLGNDVRSLPYVQRRQLLELAFKNSPRNVNVVERVTSNFKEFFERVSADGGEGIVLKRNQSRYVKGKTDSWVRCKRFRYVDYYVMSIGRSDGGSPNFQVGLLINGKMTRVATIKNLPLTMKDPCAFVGTVVECKGLEVHSSGALRHGHFERSRPEKSMDECTLEAALNA